MNRRPPFLLAAIIILSLLMAPAGAGAQPPDPDQPSYVIIDNGLRQHPWHRPDELPKVAGDRPAMVDLGQSGRSLRYHDTLGITGSPYRATSTHLNRPNGMAIADDGTLYVVEQMGYRLLGFDSGGVRTLSIGLPGQPWHSDDLLPHPKDVAVDAGGNLWVAVDPALKQYDSQGRLLRTLPDNRTWLPGSNNIRFRDPQGVAIDGQNRMFVSDTGNHRIQVYQLSNGEPTYSATIGETGVTGSDNDHFNYPAQVAVDSQGRLYVADADNFRVQRCVFSDTWTCTTFHGTGQAGSGATELNLALGLGVDDLDNVYIADTGNGRIKRCTAAGSCSNLVTGLRRPADVVVDAASSLFVSDWLDSTVRQYDNAGNLVGIFAGTENSPYPAEGDRFNSPAGVGVAPDGSLYVVEARGYRLVKLDTGGRALWSVGQVGVAGSDNTHLGDLWSGPEGNVAVDETGRVYVTDTPNNRVQVFNADGTFHRSVGEFGTGTAQFKCPTGVAIDPVRGDIVVADRCNHRIQVFDSGWSLRRTLGETGQDGFDSRHFRNPSGVAVDAEGAIFVADAGNQRVQRCALSADDYECATFAGETGIFGDDFGHLHPVSVAVDSAGKVYAADLWNFRVQVFDADGTYLTTIGGQTGTNTGRLRTPTGVAVDRQGKIYVADQDNHRIQTFAPGVPQWQQKNINGFGDRWTTGVSALEPFGGRLYAGTSNWERGGNVWRSSDGHSWTTASEPGFGGTDATANPAITDLMGFSGQLYAGTGWGQGGGQLWRSTNGTSWSRVVTGGFGSSDNAAITALIQFGDYLYASTENSATGAEIWRSNSGNDGSWTRVVNGGFDGNANNSLISSLQEFQGFLYATVDNLDQGAQVWRTDDGVNWTQAARNGLGTRNNSEFGALTDFEGELYMGTRNDAVGGQVWRTDDGRNWEPVIVPGFGDGNNIKIEGLYAFGNHLVAVTYNQITGLEVWRSPDGDNWHQVGPDGLGDSNNDATLWSHAIATFDDSMYLGTWNWGNGGELWKYLPRSIYLPAVLE